MKRFEFDEPAADRRDKGLWGPGGPVPSFASYVALILALATCWGTGCTSGGMASVGASHAADYQHRGAVLLGQGDLDGAASLFALALEFSPSFSEAENGLGVVALKRQNLDAARGHFHRALDLNPNYAEAHYNLGSVDLDELNYAGAKAHFEQALAIDPGYSDARMGLAESQVQLGDVRGARWSLNTVVAAEPENAAALGALAMVFVFQDRVADAEGMAARALAIDAGEANARRAKARVRRRGGAPREAVEIIDGLRATGDASDEDRMELIKALMAIPDLESAADEADAFFGMPQGCHSQHSFARMSHFLAPVRRGARLPPAELLLFKNHILKRVFCWDTAWQPWGGCQRHEHTWRNLSRMRRIILATKFRWRGKCSLNDERCYSWLCLS